MSFPYPDLRAIVRRTIWGLHREQINVYLLNADDHNVVGADQPGSGASGVPDPDEEEQYCWHYFVHYNGWNVKWDRWVDESALFVDSEGTRKLAAHLKQEMKLINKAVRSGTKSGKNEILAIRKRMQQAEDERREEERREELRAQGLLPPEPEKREEEDAKEGAGDECVGDKGDDGGEGDKTAKEEESERGEEQASRMNKNVSKAVLEKERKLRRRGLEGKLWRKQSHAQQIVFPFTLKKVMVEEWEIIALCGMVPKLPAKVTVREALDRFLQSKFDVFRDTTMEGEGNDPSLEQNADVFDTADNENATEEKKEEEPTDAATRLQINDTDTEETRKKKKEWMTMVNGVAQFFDEALPVHLLYKQEKAYHRAIMRSDDPLLEGKRPCEIYGCEQILRMMVQLPTMVQESGVPESDARKIMSQMNDFLRFLQKDQGDLLSQSYRKPIGKEITADKKKSPKKKEGSEGSNLEAVNRSPDDEGKGNTMGIKKKASTPPSMPSKPLKKAKT